MIQLIMVTNKIVVYSFENVVRESDLKKDLLGHLYYQHGKQVITLPAVFQPKH